MMGLNTREMLDIAEIRRRTKAVHVSDEDVLTAFSDGRGVFDVDLHCRKLDAFIAKHKLEADIYTEELCPVPIPKSEIAQFTSIGRWQVAVEGELRSHEYQREVAVGAASVGGPRQLRTQARPRRQAGIERRQP
jgi:hypothetical protein